MNFTENQQGSAILDKLQAQRTQGRFCDVEFLVDNHVFRAHRNVLAASSPYLDTILKKDVTDSNQVTVECRHQVFKVLLDYIYTGTICVDNDTVEDLMRLSNRFVIFKLKGYCAEYLERNITVCNSFLTRDIAQKCGLTALAKTADAFLLANIIDIVQQDEILALSEKRIQEFVSNKTLPVREELKVHVINRWVRHGPEQRQTRFQHLLGLLSWDKVSASVLHTILDEDPLYKDSEWCLYSMLSLMEEQGVLAPPYRPPLDQLRLKYAQSETVTQLLQLAMASTLQEPGRTDSPPAAHSASSIKQEQATLCTRQNDSSGPEPRTELAAQDLTPQQSLAADGAHSDSSQPDIILSSTGEIVEEQLLACRLVSDMQEILVLNPELAEEDQPLEISVPPADNDQAFNDLEDISDSKPSNGSNSRRGRPKHKRKGIPVKIDHSPITVRIPKSKLKMDINVHGDVPKRRGRPPKLAYKKDGKKPNIRLKQRVVKKESSEGIESDHNIENRNSSLREYGTDNDGNDSEYSDKILTEYDSHKKGKRVRKPKSSVRLQCDECSFTTTLEEKLERHHERAHKDNRTYSCSLCSFQSAWNRQYYHHMKVHFPGPPFVCDYSCGYSGERIQQLLYHRMSHTDERPFECTVCNLTFRSKNNLAMHVRCHTGAKPYKCGVCDRCFATKGTLDQHSVTHSDLRPYLCDLCGFSTKYQSHLIAHKRIHTGDVFHCQYPNCKYSTPKRSQLACHMRTHMSLRSHICSTCGRGFVEKSHLVRHEKIHLSDKPFKCQCCDYGSTRRDKLKDHMTKYHEAQDTSPPKTPYKARKPRRQTFDPHAFPLLTSEQASQEMQSLLQQSDTVRQQQRFGPAILGDELKTPGTAPGPGRDTFPYATLAEPHASLPEPNAPLGTVLTEHIASTDPVADSVQSMLLDPRLLMASSPTSQAPAPPTYSHEHLLRGTTPHAPPTYSQASQPDPALPTLHSYMSIF